MKRLMEKLSLAKVIEYGLYLLAFFLPWQTRLIIRAGELNGGYSEYSTLSLYATDLLLMTLILLFIILCIRKYFTRNIADNEPSGFCHFCGARILVVFALLEFVYIVSIFVSIDKFVAGQRYFWFLLGLGFFFLLVKAEYSSFKLLLASMMGAFLQSSLGLWQFFQQETFGSKWLGLANHSSSDLGDSVIETLGDGRWLRAYGGFDHPNIFGAYMVIVLLFFLFFYISYDEGKRLDKFSKKLLVFFASLFLMAGLFVSFSRSAWLALLLCLLWLGVLVLWQKEHGKFLILVKVGLSFFVVFLFLGFFYQDLVQTRLSGSARLELKSNQERIESVIDARAVIKDNWFLGVGAGNYTIYQHQANEVLPAWSYQPVHNVFLLIWSELGLLGLVLYACLAFEVLYLFVKKGARRGGNVLYSTLLLALLIFSTFDHWLFSFHLGVLLFWLVLGISFRKLESKIL